MTTSEYIQYWGEQNLMQYDAAMVSSLSIPAESKQFIGEKGEQMLSTEGA